MLRSLKLFSCGAALAALAFGLQQPAAGFVLLGPPPNLTPGADQWQVPDLGYFVPGRAEIGGPRNLGEEYRRNTPVLYYTFDANFLDYFGDGGAASVDQGFGIFNDVFNTYTNVDMLSSDLSEIPTEVTRINYRAEALGILDMKSALMTVLIENLGLGTPLRFTWNLHDRYLPPGGTCPLSMEYLVMQRNYDPVISTTIDQLKPSAYVNGVLYTYQIHDFCSAPPFDALSEALEFPVDVTQVDTHLPVAANLGGLGSYYTGLTLDDVGGLRYLLSARNMNTESTGPNITMLVTNSTPALLYTSNLNLLAAQALTNDAATLQALFPGLVVAGSSNFFGTIAITNTTGYFTNYPWDPVGSPAHLAFSSSVTYSVIPMYQHTFANVVLISNSPSGFVTVPLGTLPAANGQVTATLLTSSVGVANNPWGPVGSTTITTSSTATPVLVTNFVSGEYILLQSNLCAFGALIPALTNVVAFTNNLLSTTNASGATNVSGTQLSFSEDLITFYTNHVFVTFPVQCLGTNVSLLEGVQRIVFIRRDYDSLLTRFFYPITNEYVLYSVTNSSVLPRRVRRAVTSPDFLITAADLSPGPATVLFGNALGRDIQFNPSQRYPGLAGPGTIETPTTFTFSKASPIYENTGLTSTNAWLTEISQTPFVVWGSYDGSTNPPVIYPTDVSIGALEAQVLVQISPLYLPDGKIGQPYSAQINAVSSTPNWGPAQGWSLAASSPGLPPGLSISTAGAAGVISGTPTQTGFYDFSVTVTDGQGRTLDHSFSINVNP